MKKWIGTMFLMALMHTAFAQYGDSFGNQDVKADYILEDISQLLQIVQSHNAS